MNENNEKIERTEETEKKDIFDRIMSLPGLRVFEGIYKRHKSILLYIFFGGLTTVVSIGTFYVFYTTLAMNELVANIISWIFAVLFAYATNRTWVFESRSRGREILGEAAGFFGGRLSTLGVESLILFVFATLLRLNANIVKIAAQIVVLVLNYIISKILFSRGKKS